MAGLDPGSFTSYGVLGLLGFSLAMALVILYKLFHRQSESLDLKDKQFIEALNDQREEHRQSQIENSATLKEVVDKLSSSQGKVEVALLEMSRAAREMTLTLRVVDRIERTRKPGSPPLTREEIESIVRSVQLLGG